MRTRGDRSTRAATRRRFALRLLQRTVQTAVTLLVASILVWSLTGLTPDDPARRVVAAQNPLREPTPAQIEAVRQELGLDQPVWRQYLIWASGAVTGDLGTSWRTGRPVSEEFRRYLPPTLVLTAASMLVALGVSIPLGLLGAATAGRWPDALVRLLSFVLVSAPSFLVGVLLLQVVVLRWGFGSVVATGGWSTVWLPAIALAAWPAASWARILRGGLLEASSAPFMQVSTARGAGRLRLLVVHALPNTAVPFLAIVGVSVGYLLAGTPVIETVFTWPGIGRFTVESINARDLPVVQAFTLFAVLAFVLSSLVVDLVSAVIDPRLIPTERKTRLTRWAARA